MAEWITDRLSSDYEIRNRGVKILKHGDRGFTNLYFMHCQGIRYSFIMEPTFANFETSESIKFFGKNSNGKIKEYAYSLYLLIEKLITKFGVNG